MLKAYAIDSMGILGVHFFSDTIFLGETWRNTADTYRMGWDCSQETLATHNLFVSAYDDADSTDYDQVRVFVRRAGMPGPGR